LVGYQHFVSLFLGYNEPNPGYNELKQPKLSKGSQKTVQAENSSQMTIYKPTLMTVFLGGLGQSVSI